MIRKHFRLKRLVLGLAFAAFAVPAVPAAAASLSYYADGGAPPVSYATDSHNITSEHSARSDTLTPLQVEGMRWQAIADAYRQPSAAISGRSLGVPRANPSSTPLVASSTSGGFDWQDAGIGASAAFGVALVLLTVVALGRRHRSGLDQAPLTSA
jgi:hypothetical protein